MIERGEFLADSDSIDSEIFLKHKMDIQRAVIQVLIPVDTDNRAGEIMKWIEENSSKFRLIFQTMAHENPDFFSRCEQDKDAVVEEIVQQLKGM